MPAAVVPTAFEQVEEPGEVGVRIGVRIDQGMAYPRLRCEMHDLGKSVRREQVRHRLAIGDIDALEPEIGRCLELRDARLFQARIIVGIEVVDADDVVAVRQQAPCDVHADEPGRTGDENRAWQASSFPAVSRDVLPLFALGSRRYVQYKTRNAKSPQQVMISSRA